MRPNWPSGRKIKYQIEMTNTIDVGDIEMRANLHIELSAKHYLSSGPGASSKVDVPASGVSPDGCFLCYDQLTGVFLGHSWLVKMSTRWSGAVVAY
jgi:hypothetical protein